MFLNKCFTILCLVGAVLTAKLNYNDYMKQRKQLIDEDLNRMLGSDLVLSDKESQVNDILMRIKAEEVEYGFNTTAYSPAKSFFLSKPEIDASPTFQFIRRMPKGAVLHSHDMALTSVDWVVSELTYWDDLYMCYLEDHRMLFKFFEEPDDSCDWKLVKSERESYLDPATFDLLLRYQLTIITDDPDDYENINEVWEKFNKAFQSLEGLTMYIDAWKAYLTKAMEEFRDDKVVYFEFRGVLPALYEKNGLQYTPEETIRIYEEIVRNFTTKNSEDFFGVKFIYAPFRGVDEHVVSDYVELAAKLRTLQPEFVAGFDLVGQEDKGHPLKKFIDPILRLQTMNVSIPVFFHAGETDWQGVSTDENIFDAILLNSTRIGHGYAISKHPRLMEILKERNIPIEICPVSNQVLKLVVDLRNHPMAGLLADNFPAIVSSDDPGLWDALPLSHDFYEAFLALGGAKADLRFLKKLALNSISYSSLNEVNKQALRILWQAQWDEFIDSQITQNRNGRAFSVPIYIKEEKSDESNHIHSFP